MTLIELRDYVQSRKTVSELEIATHFNVERSVIEPMAERWVRKGLMKIEDMDKARCAGCASCAGGIRRHYEWLGPQSIQIMRK